MYGCVVSVPHPSENKFDFEIKWDMLRLPDRFTITQYPIFTSVANAHALKLHIHPDKNRDKTNCTFTEKISQIVQNQVQE